MNYIDLFCGCGGLSVGLESAGFNLVYANEIDGNAVKTFEYNLNHEGKIFSCSIEDLHDSIRNSKITLEYKSEIVDRNRVSSMYYQNKGDVDQILLEKIRDINDIDLIAGGPPCQGFSNASKGRRNSKYSNYEEYIDDSRNQLFKYFLGLVEYHNPKLLLIENVKGLTTSSDYRNLILNSIENTGEGYIPISIVLNASDYGVPQNRERIFFLGIRNDLKDAEQFAFYLPSILARKRKPKVSTKEAIFDLPQIRSNPKPLNQSMESEIPIGKRGSFGELVSAQKYEVLIPNQTPYSLAINSFKGELIIPNNLFNHKCRYNNENDLKIYKRMVPGAYLTDSRNKNALKYVTYGVEKDENGKNTFTSSFADKYFKLDPDSPSKTITAHLALDNNGFIHYGKIPRGISVREAARLQSFPDWFEFKGPFTKQYKQIGNAVPPLLAKMLGDILKEYLDKGFDSLLE